MRSLLALPLALALPLLLAVGCGGSSHGTDRFEPEGEFFRCTIEQATFR